MLNRFIEKRIARVSMKGKHSKQRSHRERQSSDKYRNVLKERPYREEDVKKRDESRRDHSKHQDHKSRGEKHGSSREESYEELSRKKRKIESELQALDLEEAAEAKRRADEKKKSSEQKKQKEVRVKEEPLSGDEDSKKQVHSKPKPSRALVDPKPEDDRSWGNSATEPKKPEKPKDKPDFAVSGKLAEDTNTYNGVVIKYNEPSEARKPRRRWRLYPFKGDTELPFLPIHRQSAYLFGRTRSIADIPIDHPSCSKQHAVLQFRLVPYQREDGTKGRRVRPYIIDLESSNGTFVNNKKIDARCYVELMEKDVVKFGFSTREYVILHEESRNDEEDDDILDSN